MNIGEWFLVLLPLLAFGIIAINSVRYTASDSDSMWYHLPLVAEIIKNHSIRPAQVIPLIARGYPGAREAIVAWLTFPMTSDNLALLFLLEVPGVGVCMYGICREFGVPRGRGVGRRRPVCEHSRDFHVGLFAEERPFFSRSRFCLHSFCPALDANSYTALCPAGGHGRGITARRK